MSPTSAPGSRSASRADHAESASIRRPPAQYARRDDPVAWPHVRQQAAGNAKTDDRRRAGEDGVTNRRRAQTHVAAASEYANARRRRDPDVRSERALQGWRSCRRVPPARGDAGGPFPGDGQAPGYRAAAVGEGLPLQRPSAKRCARSCRPRNAQPAATFVMRCADLLGIHKCLGVAPSGATRARWRFPRHSTRRAADERASQPPRRARRPHFPPRARRSGRRFRHGVELASGAHRRPSRGDGGFRRRRQRIGSRRARRRCVASSARRLRPRPETAKNGSPYGSTPNSNIIAGVSADRRQLSPSVGTDALAVLEQRASRRASPAR